MKEAIQTKVAGDVLKADGGSLVVRTIGKDNKGEMHEDLHMIVVSNAAQADVAPGSFVTVIGKIIDIDRCQMIQAGSVVVSDPAAGYKNLAQVYGLIEKETVFYPRKIDESTGKTKQPFANVTIKALGTRCFGTLFGNLAADWKKNGPIGSEVVLYGRMRRKEMKSFDQGPDRKYIDVASDDFNFPGQSKILKKGPGAVNEFANLDAEMLAFTQGVIEEAPKAEEKPAKGSRKAK
jgi:hypothetical protein